MHQWSNIWACTGEVGRWPPRWRTAHRKQTAKLFVVHLAKYRVSISVSIKFRPCPMNWILTNKFTTCILISSQGFSVLISRLSCHCDHTSILSRTVSVLLSSSSDSSSLSLSSASSSESLSSSLSSLSSESSSLSAATSTDGLTST